ncbi:MAG TPA: methyltransferase domain-containing protein, partial [Longimicrobiales bacterium]|nr:methyltransferase domain-containing protein [Longimicrobiales bacterium]
MSALPRVEQAVELLDQPAQDQATLLRSLEHVAQINRWLGGTRSLLRELAALLDARDCSVLDIGTGNGALPIALVQWARARKLPSQVRATDVHPQMLAFARAACAARPEIVVETADALRLPYPDGAFTVAILSLTLHHFDGEAQVRVLREAARVSRRAVIVSELERGWPNYLGARLLAATWWRSNPITRHDGPLSVLRAFTRTELLDLARAAGLRDIRGSRHFFYRLVLVGRP